MKGLERLESPILTYPRSLWSDAAARPWGHRFLDSSCRVSASVVPKMSSETVEGAVPSSAAQGDYPGRGAPLCSAVALRQLVRHPNRRGVSSIECKPDGSVDFTFHGAGNSHRGLSKNTKAARVRSAHGFEQDRTQKKVPATPRLLLQIQYGPRPYFMGSASSFGALCLFFG